MGDGDVEPMRELETLTNSPISLSPAPARTLCLVG